MKMLGKLLAIAVMIPGAAAAADLPVKAPAQLSSITATSGWYVAVATEAAVQQANISGANLFATSLVGGSLKADGGSVGGCGGWIGGNAQNWYRVDACLLYSNITGGNDAGSIASRWSSTQEIDVGANVFAGLMTWLGNSGVSFPSFTPTPPSGIAVDATPRQYFGAGLRERGLSGTFFGADGAGVYVAPMVTSGFLWKVVDSTGRPTGSSIDMKVYAAFPMRGFTINNAFASNGTQLTAGAGASLGTEYGARISWMFGLGN